MSDSKEAKALFKAVDNFLAPLMAEYGRLIDEAPAEEAVIMDMSGYTHKTTMASLKALDGAHMEYFYEHVEGKGGEERLDGSEDL